MVEPLGKLLTDPEVPPAVAIPILQSLLQVTAPGANWFADYGMTSKRADALTQPAKNRNSFYNQNSETALTLFLLGNLDSWSQVGTLTPAPRDPVKSDGWSGAFFEWTCKPAGASATAGDKPWLQHASLRGALFGNCTPDIAQAVLLFEFQLPNTAFNATGGRAFCDYSFLRSDTELWCQHDAVLILPRARLLVFFEAKLGSDISRSIKGYRFISQLMRGLESAYFLTYDQASLYNGWDFRYVILCPRQAIEYGLTYYSLLLRGKVGLTDQFFRNWRSLLVNEYGARLRQDYSAHFDKLLELAQERVTALYWDEVGRALEVLQPEFFQRYHAGLDQCSLTDVEKAAIQARFDSAGVIFGPLDAEESIGFRLVKPTTGS